jgi:crossover junction endodeoxyribonuclease RuvC
VRIIGIDPGTGILGFGVIDHNSGKTTMVDAGVVRTKVHQPLDERLVEIYNSLCEIVAENKPTVMVIEKQTKNKCKKWCV